MIDRSLPSLEVDALATACSGRVLRRSRRPVRGGAVDSRLVRPDNLFVALPGTHTDGHLHLDAAVAAGASALIVTRPLSDAALTALGDVSVLLVDDGIAALGSIAAAWRKRFDPLVVGVTGSIAKTSVKEAAAAVLSRHFRTLRNAGNQNNEIGLPLTLLALEPDHEAVVLEMGMYVGGEVAALARIARPGIGVVTAVQGVHLSRIGSIEAIEAAKGELVEALPGDGTAILNADDPRVARMAERTRASVLTYGLAVSADVTARDVRSAGTAGMDFTLVTPGAGLARRPGVSERPVSIPGLGRLAVHNGLAAAAVGIAAGLGIDEIAAGLTGGWSAPHRGVLRTAGAITIVDDSYNASPASVTAALELLEGLPGRRVAVLGTMLELGDESVDGHLAVGRVASSSADLLIVVGADAAAIAESALATGMAPDRVVHVADRDAALSAYLDRRRDGDVVLVKASRGVELDVFVEDLVSALDATGLRP